MLFKQKQSCFLSTLEPQQRNILKSICSRDTDTKISNEAMQLRWRNVRETNWYKTSDKDFIYTPVSKDELEFIYDIAFKNGVTPSSVLSAVVN